MGLSRTVARLGIVAVLVTGVLAVAAPASAHEVAGVGATNYRTTLAGLSPSVAGLDLRVVENGARLQLRNDTPIPVVVLGYEGEPYARVQPDGVFVNDRSPATYLNVDRFSTKAVPAEARTGASPVWRKVADEPVWRWHDHRIHWMATALPPAVAADPGQFRHLSSWTVALDYSGHTLTASGALDWVPGPAPWPWFASVFVLVAAVVAAARVLRRSHLALASAAAVTLIADVVHTAGAAAATAGGVAAKVGVFMAFGPSQPMLWAAGVAATVMLARARARAVWVTVLAAVWVVVVTGVADLAVLWRSSAPTVLPLGLDRASLVAVLGAGIGLIAAAPIFWWRRAARAGGADADGADAGGADAGGADAGGADAGAVGSGRGGGKAKPRASRSGMAVTSADPAAGVARREVVGYLAAGGLGMMAGAAGGGALAARSPSQPSTPAQDLIGDVGARHVAFHGPRQSGIVTPQRPQARVWIAAFDLAPAANLAAVRALLRAWTDAAARLTAGMAVVDGQVSAVSGLGPTALTITVGFGPSLFGKAGVPALARPQALAALPAFAGERLDKARSDGDIGVVVCADDTAVVVHAARTLRRLAAGTARLRWQMSGFDRARGAAAAELTGRNLMGQLDGTNNPRPGHPDFDATVFVPADADPAWMRGGSYLVVRRIRMLLDDWDALAVPAQERVIGRRKDSGAPLSGGDERTPPNYGARVPDGTLAIATDAHIRLAAPAFNNGAAMLRRGFSYADGTAADGAPDVGLLFLAWQADPRRAFIPVQRRLAGADALGPFIRHETSALFAMPGGVQPGQYLGQQLLSP